MDVRDVVVRALRGLVQQAKGVNVRLAYTNILRELGRTAQPVEGAADLRRVKFVGEKTCKTVSAAVLRLCGAGMDPALRRRVLRGFADGPGGDGYYSDSSCVIEGPGGEAPEDPLSDRLNSSLVVAAGDGAPRGGCKRAYVPGYRTAPYAVLRALFEQGSAHKYLVALRAAPFTDAEFDGSQRFSAFSAFRTLESRGLVFSESSKFFLTERGRALCGGLFVGSGAAASDGRIRLVIDSRERKSQRNRGFFQSYFNARQVENVTRFLGLGDFLWIRDEAVLNCIIERKSGTDLVSSISDGRYREQKKRLKTTGLRVFYLVENARCGEAMAGLCMFCLTETRMDGFTVLETEDIGESGEVICMLDRRMREGGFSEEMSYGSFIEEGAKQMDVHTLLLCALLGVRGLGRERAAGLADRFGTMDGFLRRVEAPGFVAELAGTVVGGRKVGGKMAQRIVRMLG